MSVFTRLYIHSPWSLDTADHTILLATAHIHNHFWLLHPPMVPNGPDAASHTPQVGLCKGETAVASSIHPLNRKQCNIGWIQTYLYKFTEL